MGAQPNEQVREALRSALDFADLDDEALADLARGSTLRGYAAGERIFEKGSAADGLYVVISGSVRIEDLVHGRQVEIARIGPGDFFGEVSLALHTARTRAARAAAGTEVLVVPVALVRRLAESRPHLHEELMTAFEDRMPLREERADD
jgi:CRP-like cAMP-binding protein